MHDLLKARHRIMEIRYLFLTRQSSHPQQRSVMKLLSVQELVRFWGVAMDTVLQSKSIDI